MQVKIFHAFMSLTTISKKYFLNKILFEYPYDRSHTFQSFNYNKTT